jgi:hypothetical protein
MELELRELMSIGERHGWARGDDRRGSEFVMTVFCMSVLCRGWPGAGSCMVRTENLADRAGTERMKVEEGRLVRGED